MEFKLNNGRYIAQGGDVATVRGAEELAQRITMKLTARRGKFWPLPNYGSRLYTLLHGVKPHDRIRAIREFVAEALADEPDVSLVGIDMSIEGDSLILRLDFKYYGGAFSLETAFREET